MALSGRSGAVGVPPGTLQRTPSLASLASVLSRLLLGLIVLAAASLSVSAPVLAHNGVDPWLEVSDAVQPGGLLSVAGGELDRGGLVRLTLWVDGRTYRIGQLRADGEGHFAAQLALPAGVAEGYGQLTAATVNFDASLWIEIGGAAGGPSTTGDTAWLRRLVTDPSVLLLGALLTGGALGLGYRILWPGRRRQAARR